jgi:hypothetical protein
MFKATVRYTRYLLATLATVAFSLNYTKITF